MSRKKNDFVSPYPTGYKMNGHGEPEASLRREVTTINQTRYDEYTLKWGDDDAFPLRIIDAVNSSPTASSCIGTIETFIRGNGFSDEALMNLKIDKDGTTLYELHCQLAQYMALLDGFSVNFKFDSQGKITNTFLVNLETVRFVKPTEDSPIIDRVKVNPYFGTGEYLRRFSKEYPLWNPEALQEQIAQEGTKFPGQIYFYGRTRPPFKFYPVPKYWSGEKWIYVDGKIQNFHKKNLDNGFFLSVLMNVIGDPNQPSKNPKYQTTELGSDGVTKFQRSTKTVGEEFNIMMSEMFSGEDKTGAIMALWSMNADNSVKLQPFPVNAQFDVMSGTFTDAIRGITIATEVPAILANLPQQASSLGSDGNAMNMAIQLMQARTSGKKRILENFYNTILLPNLQTPPKEQVKILDYSPISSAIDFYNFHAFELYWAFMNDQDKIDFINNNVDEITLSPRVVNTAPAITQPAQPVQPQQSLINEDLKKLKLSEINRVTSIMGKYKKGLLTLEQANQLLTSYGFDEEQVKAWLNPNYETANPVGVFE